MRVRSGRNNQVGSRYEASGGSGSVTLSLDPEDFDAAQTLGFQSRAKRAKDQVSILFALRVKCPIYLKIHGSAAFK